MATDHRAPANLDKSRARTLLDEVEAASGGDRDLDENIAVSFQMTVADEPADHYTASIDACLALVERVRPGWYWKAGHGTYRPGWAHLYREHPDNTQPGDGEFTGYAATPALAIIAALLRSEIDRADR